MSAPPQSPTDGRLRAAARGLRDSARLALREIQDMPGCQSLSHVLRRDIHRTGEILTSPRRHPARKRRMEVA